MIKIEAAQRLKADAEEMSVEEGPHVIGEDAIGMDAVGAEGQGSEVRVLEEEPEAYAPAVPNEPSMPSAPSTFTKPMKPAKPSTPSKPTEASRRIFAGRETGSGAGALFYAQDTGNFLLVLRSAEGDEPNTWCGLGGGIEEGEKPDEAVRRESWEEAKFPEEAPCDLRYIGCHEQPDFRFHNYLGLVPEEFTPVLNEEHTDHQWCSWDKFPKNMHPKMMEALGTEMGQRLLSQHTNYDERKHMAIRIEAAARLMAATAVTEHDMHEFLHTLGLKPKEIADMTNVGWGFTACFNPKNNDKVMAALEKHYKLETTSGSGVENYKFHHPKYGTGILTVTKKTKFSTTIHFNL